MVGGVAVGRYLLHDSRCAGPTSTVALAWDRRATYAAAMANSIMLPSYLIYNDAGGAAPVAADHALLQVPGPGAQHLG